MARAAPGCQWSQAAVKGSAPTQRKFRTSLPLRTPRADSRSRMIRAPSCHSPHIPAYSILNTMRVGKTTCATRVAPDGSGSAEMYRVRGELLCTRCRDTSSATCVDTKHLRKITRQPSRRPERAPAGVSYQGRWPSVRTYLVRVLGPVRWFPLGGRCGWTKTVCLEQLHELISFAPQST